MYLVLFSGPQPLSIPVHDVDDKDLAVEKALRELSTLELDMAAFTVSRVYGPEDSPRFKGE